MRRCAFHAPSSGRILVDGTDLATVRLDSYRRKAHVLDARGERLLSLAGRFNGTPPSVYQELSTSDIRFPTLNGLQTAVFQLSLTGKFVRQHLHPLLIESTAPETKSLAGNDSVVRGRERRFDEVLEKK